MPYSSIQPLHPLRIHRRQIDVRSLFRDLRCARRRATSGGLRGGDGL
jgi:hypothetical protein